MDDNIVIFYQAPWNWEFLWNRSQPLAQALSKHAKIYYIDGGYTRPRFFRLLSKLGLHTRLITIAKNLLNLKILYSYTEPLSILYRNNELYSKKILDLVIKEKTKGKKVWLLTGRPHIVSVIKSDLWDKIIVDIEDPWMELEWWKDSSVDLRPLAINLFKVAYKIFANGAKIADRFKEEFGIEAISLSNGINKEFIPNKRTPTEIKNKDFTIIFVGHINDRLDFYSLEKTVERFPNVIFKFAGKESVPPKVYDPWNKIKSAKNFIYLGEIKHAEVKILIETASALLLPYTDAGSKFMFPAKLLEYLSVHKPILSSMDFSRDLGCKLNQIICYSTQEELEEKIEKLVSGNLFFGAADLEKSDEILANSSWDKKAEILMSNSLE